MGYSYRCFNALTYALHMQYMNEGKFVIEDIDLFNSVVSGAIPIGAIIGSILGGILVEKGRRRAIILICTMQIIGSVFCVVFNFKCLISGRLIQGVVIGSFTVVSPLFISEISPKSISGSLGMSNQGMVVFGGILAKLFGLIVPLKGDDDILTSDNWKLIFAFPGIIAFAQLLLIIFVFRYESPTYYLMHHDLQKYSLVNSKFYNKNENDFNIILLQNFRSQSNSDKNSWLNQFSFNNRKTLIIGCVLSLLQQATGVNCVSFYSNEMFMQGLTGDDAEISARVGTLIVDIQLSYFLKLIEFLFDINETHFFILHIIYTKNQLIFKISIN